MKFYSIAALSSIGIFLASSSFAGCDVLGAKNGDQYNGMTSCVNTTESNLTVNGPLSSKHLFVKGNLTVRGPLTAENLHVSKNVHINGPVKATDITVKGNTKINGPAVITGPSKFHGSLSVNGPLMASNTVFADGNVTVKGPFKFTNSTVRSDIHYYANKAHLVNTKTLNIYDKARAEDCPQKLYLKENSVVRGNISFKSGCGVVVVSGGSKIKGNVIGGRLKQN